VQCLLSGGGGSKSSRRSGEGSIEGIADRLEDVSSPCLDCLAQQPIV